MSTTAAQLNPDTQHTAVIALSRGIRAIAHLPVFLGVSAVLSPDESRGYAGDISSVVVWGKKANTASAIRYAGKRGIGVTYLEDGWIRSSAANPHSRVCYSLQADSTGIYYDSRSSCDLEQSLNLPDSVLHTMMGKDGLRYAAACRADLIDNNITKYNFCRQVAERVDARPLVLVIDQTLDDASVRYGGMNLQVFEQMLEAACMENPHAQIVVRTHPDVVAGRRRGYLSALAKKMDILVVAGDDNPIATLKQASRVYAGTSQMGYEALLCGKPVVVFGKPFYAGYGLTEDRQRAERRKMTRSVDEMFWVTHIKHARYCNPVTGQRWQLHQCIEHVKLQTELFEKNAHNFHCAGITPWKRAYVRQYLRSPDGTVSFGTTVKSTIENPVHRVTWGFRQYHNENGATRAQSISPLHRIEDGFLRSTGLGSDFNAPASLVFDRSGLYFDPATPSDLENLLNLADCTPAQVARSVRLKNLILSGRLSKYNVTGKEKLIQAPAGKQRVLVVGQVEDDESVIRGCDAVRKNSALLAAARAARPEAWICYKPHPDVLAGNRVGKIDAAITAECADVVADQASIVDCIEECDELHTMTSLSGFEALLRGKHVVTHGAPFYAGWGLTEDIQPIARRKRRRTLDELVYLCLIAYPRYVDINTGEFITPEVLVETITSQRAMKKNKATGRPGKTLTKVVNIARGLRYAP